MLKLFESVGKPAAEEPSAGMHEIKALASAWPDRIRETAVRGGDWMLRIDDAWFAWARGRILPEAEASRWEEFAPIAFYSYPIELPPVARLDEDAAARLRTRVKENQTNPPRRSEEFFGALLSARTRLATESRLVTVEVAGFTLRVHELLKAPLLRISDELTALRKVDAAAASFLRSLIEMNGYNYRFVEGTRSRSMHSYGLAVDLIPKSYAGKDTYWMWAMTRHADWWAVPYEQRWMPPSSVIEAFEREGFVWGGKWLLFDTMHFEYRPDILLAARQNPSAESQAAVPQS
jgi:hypothetical protein